MTQENLGGVIKNAKGLTPYYLLHNGLSNLLKTVVHIVHKWFTTCGHAAQKVHFTMKLCMENNWNLAFISFIIPLD